MLWPGRPVDLAVKYRFAFGDICCYPLEKGIKRKKFDLKGEVGLLLRGR